MDWSSVILAAIGGGVGAGLGSVLVSLLWPQRKVEPGTPRKMDLRGVVLIAVTVAGAQLGQPLLDPIIGPGVRDWVNGNYESDIADLMAQEPIFQVLQDKAPERAEAWREAVATAYRRGGSEEANRVARAEGEVIGAWLVAEFGPRATDEALIGFYGSLISLTRDSLMDHPRECYGFFLPNQFPGSPSSPDLAAIGVDPTDMAHQTMEMARTAGDTPVAVDLEAAAATQSAGISAAAEVIGAENLALLGGRLPASEAEYRLVCQGMLTFLTHIHASDGAANAFRAMAAGG